VLCYQGENMGSFFAFTPKVEKELSTIEIGERAQLRMQNSLHTQEISFGHKRN